MNYESLTHLIWDIVGARATEEYFNEGTGYAIDGRVTRRGQQISPGHGSPSYDLVRSFVGRGARATNSQRFYNVSGDKTEFILRLNVPYASRLEYGRQQVVTPKMRAFFKHAYFKNEPYYGGSHEIWGRLAFSKKGVFTTKARPFGMGSMRSALPKLTEILEKEFRQELKNKIELSINAPEHT